MTTGPSANEVPSLVLNSHHNPPEPDWSLLERSDRTDWSRQELSNHIDQLATVLSSAKEILAIQRDREQQGNAQLLIQNLVLQKMNQTIHAEEHKKKDDRTKLFPGGKGRHLTGDDFIEELEQAASARAQKQVEREGRAAQWKKVADFNDHVKTAWEGCQATYERAVDEWRGHCNELLSQGTMKKNLPSKPARMLKKDVIRSVHEAEVETEESSGSEGGEETDGKTDNE